MKRSFLEKAGDFMLGKGFYIVLFLCVAAIGISGYFLLQNVTGETGNTPVTGNPVVELPDVSTPTPVVQAPAPSAGEEEDAQEAPAASGGAGQAPARQPDDPQPETRAALEVYTWPVKGEVLTPFSVEALAYDPTMGDWRTHAGVDIAAQADTKVLAMRGGTVARIYNDDLMGVCVSVDHGDGLVSTYCGLAEAVSVQEGQAVDTGTILGTVGNTAIAESALPSHLHLEASLDGQAVDPIPYLPER